LNTFARNRALLICKPLPIQANRYAAELKKKWEYAHRLTPDSGNQILPPPPARGKECTIVDCAYHGPNDARSNAIKQGLRTNLETAPRTEATTSNVSATLMSALPPKADACSAARDVCYGPIADISRSRRQRVLDRAHGNQI
jgi:hypothetical protein